MILVLSFKQPLLHSTFGVFLPKNMYEIIIIRKRNRTDSILNKKKDCFKVSKKNILTCSSRNYVTLKIYIAK